ncbi:fimbria/pilus outer membrane usher protein [Pseudomonas sp. PDM18]|uniref:fimbria/pilus outer membrane usher protein n=1 Tax=Pseudomonas sp. PDM18 TaxID=2769253 RepID=UPI001CE0BB92|nr:fimbria/pilus outer membrane usher protein [Pseudomonas sp. PDM18]
MLARTSCKPNALFRLAPGAGAYCLAALSLLNGAPVIAAQFNASFLKDKGEGVDLRYFENANAVLPGTYDVDLYLNQRLDRRAEVTFQNDPEAEMGEARPVLPLGLLRSMGVDVERLQQEGIVATDATDDEPVHLLRIEDAAVEMDVAQLALQISVPQAYIKRNSRGYVDPSLWDEGITALFSDYQVNLDRNSDADSSSDYGYLGLRNGLNIGPWRLRNDSSIRQGTGMPRTFTSNRTFVERDITSLKSRFALGQLYTDGDIFDSSRIKGLQLSSDTGMLPDDEAGYAPTVRGIAESNARVEIRQNGYVIYSTSVSPGAFEIRDIYPSGSNGDLEITIVEEDGRERKFTQAYSYLPIMARRGSLQYHLSLGQYDGERSSKPTVLQGTAVYGLGHNLTSYGGLLHAEDYSALNAGVGVNSSLGGMSMDVTTSRSRPTRGKSTAGQSVRFLYSKTLNQTDTTFTMAGYRYSTSGYRTLNEHIDEQERDRNDEYYYSGRPKHRLDLTVNQAIGSRGSVYLSAGETNYWDRTGGTRRLQLGFSSNYKDLSYNVSASHTQDVGQAGGSDNQLTVSVSIPFGSRARAQRFYSNATTAGKGQDSLQAGVSGYLNDSNNLSYSAHTGQFGSEHSAGAGMAWDAPSAKLAGNMSRSGTANHYDLTASGSVIAHSDGITLSQPVGETFALIEVPGVKDVGLENSHVRTDHAGYMVAGYVQPYRYNWLNLDTKTLGSDVDVGETSKQLVPRRGAIVKASFDAASGRRIQFVLAQADGSPLPFATQVLDQDNKLLAVVDNLSRALVFGIPEKGTLKVRWAKGSCAVPYKLPERNSKLKYEEVKATCSGEIL